MLQYFRVQKARRSVVDEINSLIDISRRRIGSVSDNDWRAPYMIGYLTMLISLTIDGKTEGPLTVNNLGLAQLEIWREITGLHDETIGEQICMLSAGQDPLFVEGCRNAGRFFKAAHGEGEFDEDVVWEHFTENFEELGSIPTGSGTNSSGFGHHATRAETLWIRYFEERLG